LHRARALLAAKLRASHDRRVAGTQVEREAHPTRCVV
jgi:hypothetical protein